MFSSLFSSHMINGQKLELLSHNLMDKLRLEQQFKGSLLCKSFDILFIPHSLNPNELAEFLSYGIIF